MKTRANGIDIHYTTDGAGPWLVMSHSLACDSRMWDEQVAVLSKRFKVLRFDTRGHGQTDAPKGEYTLVEGLPIDAFSQECINKTLAELQGEQDGVKHLL